MVCDSHKSLHWGLGSKNFNSYEDYNTNARSNTQLGQFPVKEIKKYQPSDFKGKNPFPIPNSYLPERKMFLIDATFRNAKHIEKSSSIDSNIYL